MLKTVQAIVRDGKIELLEKLDIPEGTPALVTLMPDEEREFWLNASRSSLDKVWDNAEDNVYEPMSEEDRARKLGEVSESLLESHKKVYEELAKGEE
jgi:hypothetical protein